MDTDRSGQPADELMPGAWGVDAEDLRRVAARLGREADGVKLRRDLSAELRQAVEPGVADARGRILTMGAGGIPHEEGGSLRAAIAGGVKAKTRLSGTAAGVRVTASKKGMPRGFANAPKRTNRAKGWRHPVPPPRLGKGVEGPQREPKWVHQIGLPGWFDDPLKDRKNEYRRAVQRVIANAKRRIGGGT